MTGERVLAGLRVVDASTTLAGSLAAMLLADFGADVVKVGESASAHDATFVVWDRGKRRSPGQSDDELQALIEQADVCVVSALASDLEGSPLHPTAATTANPRLVHLSTPPWRGGSTPWADTTDPDPLLAARTGVSLRQASVDDVPVESIYSHLTTVQGGWAAAAAMAAVVERERSGLGQRVEVGGLHGALVASAAAFNFDPTAAEPAARRAGGSGGSVPFYRTYQCSDGEWLFLAALTPRFTELAFAALGITELMDDERLGGKGRAAMLTPEHAAWVIETIAEVFRSRPRAEWLERLAAAGCPAGPLLDRDDWLDHPQLAAIGMRAEVDDPNVGRVVMPGVPIRLGTATADGSPRELAPDDGESGHRTEERVGRGPLDGVRVLDLGAIIAGPYSASLLAELGADVIKVEPLAGDSFRGPGFAAYNKGQRGIALNLQDERGRDAFLRLVETADVVVDNYRPGVLGRLRLRYDDLVQVNPSIITLSVTGFGEGGPLGNEAGFDPVLQAMSGMMTAQGGDGEPVFFTVAVNDVTAAASGALAVCLALFRRQRSGGEGTRTWTSLAGMSAMLQADELTRWDGRSPAARGGRDHPGPSDDNRYHRVADGWVRVRGLPADESWLHRSRQELVADLTAKGVPAAAALRTRELVEELSSPDVQALHPDPRPGREHWWTVGRHARFSRTEQTGTLVSPTLGQHTREVLLEAGFAGDEVERLIADGVARAARDPAG